MGGLEIVIEGTLHTVHLSGIGSQALLCVSSKDRTWQTTVHQPERVCSRHSKWSYVSFSCFWHLVLCNNIMNISYTVLYGFSYTGCFIFKFPVTPVQLYFQLIIRHLLLSMVLMCTCIGQETFNAGSYLLLKIVLSFCCSNSTNPRFDSCQILEYFPLPEMFFQLAGIFCYLSFQHMSIS